MSKSYHTMSDFMACSHREFKLSYWQHKGHALGDPKPRIKRRPKHQPSLVEALEDADTYQTMLLAFGSAKS